MEEIDWAKIKSVEDIKDIDYDILYDTAPIVDTEGLYKLNDGLEDWEKEDAEFWQPVFRGLILVTGDAGQGKDTLLHHLMFKAKRYYNRTVISDTRPRPSFGFYIPFSQGFFEEQLIRMNEVATGTIYEYDSDNPPLVRPHVTPDGKWISSRGEVFFRRAVVGLNEFGSRYMYRREPHQPIKRALLKLFNFWRHMQCVIFGVTISKDECDPSCYDKVSCEIRCFRADDRRLVFGYDILPFKYISSTGELQYVKRGGKKRAYIVADEPVDALGGLCWKDIFNTDNAVGFEVPKGMRSKKRRVSK